MEYLIIAVLTIAASALTGTVGVGGALIIVPALTVAASYIGLLSPEIRLIGYTMNFISLAPIVIKNRKKIDFSLARPLIVFSVIGALIGANAPLVVDEKILLSCFVGTLVVVILLLIKKMYDKTPAIDDFQHTTRNWLVVSFIGMIVGLASGLFGIGGGVFMLPLVMIFVGVKPKNIIFVTPLIVLFSTGTGIAVSLWNGVWIQKLGVAAAVILSAILGAELGDRLRGKMSDRMLQWIVVMVLLVLVVKMGMKAASL